MNETRMTKKELTRCQPEPAPSWAVRSGGRISMHAPQIDGHGARGAMRTEHCQIKYRWTGGSTGRYKYSLNSTRLTRMMGKLRWTRRRGRRWHAYGGWRTMVELGESDGEDEMVLMETWCDYERDRKDMESNSQYWSTRCVNAA